ncbi:MAG: hypothetical protein ACREQZ_05215 [Woeseiaceae bacterium]
MRTHLKMLSLATGLLALLLASPAPAFGVNKSISIEEGAQSGGESSINGSISVGANAVVSGTLETVNGAIRVADGARVADLQTVNGSIKLGAGVQTGDISGVNGAIRLGGNAVVGGEISVVNGKIEIGAGSRVARNVGNVNGELEIRGTEIGGDLSTINGDVLLTDRSLLKGDLVVERPRGGGWHQKRKPRIVIGPGSAVSGEIRVEREVELFIHDSATVGGVSGEMSLDKAVRFSGDRP